MRSTSIDLHLHALVSRSINMLSVTDFVPKGIISGVRVQAGLYLDMRMLIIAKFSQRSCGNFTGDFEVAARHMLCSLSTRRFFDYHGKGKGNFV